jgi:hypothetical protein
MEEKDKLKFVLEKLEEEVEGLMYKKPKCDFEHIWNQAVASCCDTIGTWKQDDDTLMFNEDKFKPTIEFGNNSEDNAKAKSTRENGNK